MLGSFLALAACQDFARGIGVERAIAIAAGPPETAAGCVARSLTSHVNEENPDHRTSVLRTDGSFDALLALGDGRAQLAIASADALALAVNGEGPFEGRTVSARTLATLYTDLLYLVVRDDSPIGGLSGLRDHAVGVGPGGMALTLGRSLEAARLEGRVDSRTGSWSALLDGLQDGTLGAVAWVDGLPSPAIADAVRRDDRRLRLLNSASVVPLLQQRHGALLYRSVEVPAAASGTKEPAAVVGVSTVLVARNDLDETSAFSLTSALFRLSSRLARDCPAMAALDARSGARPQPAALHPGAALFYRQQGPGIRSH